jgi:hypothetical protein
MASNDVYVLFDNESRVLNETEIVAWSVLGMIVMLQVVIINKKGVKTCGI